MLKVFAVDTIKSMRKVEAIIVDTSLATITSSSTVALTPATSPLPKETGIVTVSKSGILKTVVWYFENDSMVL